MLLKVNKNDKVIGYETKKRCHIGEGILHRAFTIFVLNKNKEVLIQKRSKDKFLWPLFWETTCSSHPQKGENIKKAAEKRLKKELGIECSLQYIGKFYYWAKYKNIGSEKEICWIFLGKYLREDINPDPKEVAEWQWVNIKEFEKDLNIHSQKYAPWVLPAFRRIKGAIFK